MYASGGNRPHWCASPTITRYTRPSAEQPLTQKEPTTMSNLFGSILEAAGVEARVVRAASDIDAASRAMTTDTDIAIPGMTRPFLPHQASGIEFVLDSLAQRGCALVGDDCGLGKTQILL